MYVRSLYSLQSRCTYCDTEYAFSWGESRERHAVLDAVKDAGVPLVCVTGGEPLLRELPEVVSELLESGFTVLIGPAGPRSRSDSGASDPDCGYQTPGALQKGIRRRSLRKVSQTHFHYPILEQLQPHDEIKFVVTSRADWSVSF